MRRTRWLVLLGCSIALTGLVFGVVLDAMERADRAEAERDRVTADLLKTIDSLRGDVSALRAQLTAEGIDPVVAEPAPAAPRRTATSRPVSTTTTARPGTTSTTTTTTTAPTTSTTQRPNQPVCTRLPITERCV